MAEFNGKSISFGVIQKSTATLQEKTATANGEVTPDAGYDGLSKVIVNVAGNIETVEEYDGTVTIA